MTATEFQRARTDEQRAQRRQHILTVTRGLLEGRRVADLSLNEISRQVGLAKPNIMRHFQSREAILLTLLQEEYGGWVDEVEAKLPQASETDPTERVASVLAQTLLARPLLCELLTATPTVLEHNVTVQEVTAFKLAVQASMTRLLALLTPYLGEWSPAQTTIFLNELHGSVMHTWALANPPPALKEVYAACPSIQDPVGPLPPELVVREILATLLTGLQHRRPHWGHPQ